jgi:hypothetical protein
LFWYFDPCNRTTRKICLNRTKTMAVDDESAAISMERSLADLELIQAAYPDEVTVTMEHPSNTFPFKFSLNLSENTSLTMELQAGYPIWKGVQVTDYRATKPSDKVKIEAVVEAVRKVSLACQAEQIEGSLSCCAAAIEAWNVGDVVGEQEDILENTEQHLTKLQYNPTSATRYAWISGEPLVDKKSTFQAHLCAVHTEQQVEEAFQQLITSSSKIQRATHNMYAWRIVEKLQGGRILTKHDNDDDGEEAAGSKLAYLLDMRNDENVLVVVSRWYGGIQLGPKRFAHIVNVARELLVANSQVRLSKQPIIYSNQDFKNFESHNFVLSAEQIDEFLENGVLVIENVLTACEVDHARKGIRRSLQFRGVHSFHEEDQESALAFDHLSSTNGSGGILDIFYDDWKMFGVATHPKLFAITTQLWKAAYNQGGLEGMELLPDDQQFQWHPYGGNIDYDKGYVYIDRLGYRLPTTLSESWGDGIRHEQKNKKLRAVQRSLTPHLDCCPDDFFSDAATKWRPIQCFVSLTDNLEPNTGGFEAAPRFHREFDQWAKHRPQPTSNGENSTTSLCVGNYTHIRPKQDESVMKRVCHVPVDAGSAVFWDSRIPHGNSYRNDSRRARMVVYCSFLPDIPLNRRYVASQLNAWRRKQPVRDQWNYIPFDVVSREEESSRLDHVATHDERKFSELGKKLMGIEKW